MSEELEKNELNEEAKKEDFVSKKAYGEVTSDMHKYKTKLKDVQAALNELKAEKDAVENERLAEQGKWEEIATRSRTELDKMKSERQDEQSKFIDFHKKNGVLNKIGGFKRDEYNNFINTNSIELKEDGSIDDVSLNAEIDRIKQTYPELLKQGTANKSPNAAPQGLELGEKTYAQMSESERLALKRNLLKK